MNKEGLEAIFGIDFEESTNNFKGLCPFHAERTGSFLINQDDGFCYCFGCGWTGDIITAIKDYNEVSYEKAKKIAYKELNFRVLHGVLSDNRRNNRVRSEEIFPESWLKAWPKRAHKSILERGLTVETIRNAEGRFDVHGRRQVFPHRNRRGALLGAAGRSCAGQNPKWLFYWSYSKGRSLYYGTNSDPQGGIPLVVVEGIFDVLWFQQHGISNVVGILGSKPSKYQVQQIKELTDTVVLALDNDAAGKEGTYKLYTKLQRGTKVRLLEWPSYANDAMDLKGDQLHDLVERAESPLSRRLSHHRRVRTLQRVSTKEE